VVCARPHARLLISGGELEAIGREDRRIHFVALDTVAGWKGIAAGSATTEDGGSIVIKYADIDYANSVSAGFQSTLTIEHSRLRRTFIGAAGNFTGFAIRNSEVNDGSVQFSTGTFEETIISRGSLSLFPGQPGSGSVTLNGGRIEDSPNVAVTIGSITLLRAPAVTVIKPLEIVGSRGGIGTMPGDDFVELWPTVAAQSSLLNNTNKHITLWGAGFGDLHLSSALDWHLYGTIGLSQINSLTLEPGATVHVLSHFTVIGPFVALGTEAQPIYITSEPDCWGNPDGCGFTLRDTANSQLSHVTLRDAYIR
jgi:hypothetical protein